MLLKFIRVIFIVGAGLTAYAVGRMGAAEDPLLFGGAGAGGATLLVLMDVLFRQDLIRKSVAVIFGILAGLFLTVFATLLLAIFVWPMLQGAPVEKYEDLVRILQAAVPMLAIALSYLAVSVVLRMKDEIRFIVPFVDFVRQGRVGGGLLLDTSVLIDGRFAALCEAGLVDVPVLIPRFVLGELQNIADSADRVRRTRGRRGLDIVNRIQADQKIEVRIHESDVPEAPEVDAKLLRLAKLLGARLVTNDFNLQKVAKIEDVEVVNIHELAKALRPVVLPGERLSVRVQRPGEEPGQGVGYLDDGTMVVVAGGRDRVGREIPIQVTSVIQTTAGRMIFGRPDPDAEGGGGGGGDEGGKPESGDAGSGPEKK